MVAEKIYFKVFAVIGALCLGLSARADDVLTAVPIVYNSSTNYVKDRNIAENFKVNADSAENELFKLFRSKTLARKFTKWENNLLKYNRINISGLKKVSKNSFTEELFPEGNPWMWSFDPRELEQKILNNPWIENVEITSSIYPARLYINVAEVKPWLITEFEKNTWLISDKGKLIQSLNTIKDPKLIFLTLDLPRLIVANNNYSSVSSLNNSRLNTAIGQIRLLEEAGGLGYKAESYKLLSDSSLEIVSIAKKPMPKVAIYLKNIDDAKLAVKRLKNILLDLSQRNDHPEKIDLRFSSQAIVK